jgi:hypothetical protein
VKTWTKAHHIRPPSQAWRLAVQHRLAMGYGVEDIALWLDCNVKYVRALVTFMRQRGELAKMWPGGSRLHEKNLRDMEMRRVQQGSTSDGSPA